jgi:hypothetical protein
MLGHALHYMGYFLCLRYHGVRNMTNHCFILSNFLASFTAQGRLAESQKLKYNESINLPVVLQLCERWVSYPKR